MSDEGIEQKYIKEAFDTNWVVSLGPNVNAFEEDLKKFVSLTPRSAEGRLQGKNPSPKGEGNWLKRWLQPVIFMQERPGRDEKIFKVIKFKTMTDERDAERKLLPDAQRLTKVGRFVRSTSIDELPQLINCTERGYGFDWSPAIVAKIFTFV